MEIYFIVACLTWLFSDDKGISLKSSALHKINEDYVTHSRGFFQNYHPLKTRFNVDDIKTEFRGRKTLNPGRKLDFYIKDLIKRQYCLMRSSYAEDSPITG